MRDEYSSRIEPLDELPDYEVADYDPDVRGWKVLGDDGRRIGEVDHLMVDTGAMKVRYLDIDLDGEALELQADRHVLVPIGYARLDQDSDQVIVDGFRSAELARMPEYTHQPLTPDYEVMLLQAFDTGFRPGQEGDLYDHSRFDENRFFGARRPAGGERRMTLAEEELEVGKREVRAGEVEISKEVESRHVRQEVPVRHDEVIVERRPATAGMSAEPRIEEGEIHVPVMEEQAVVEKRVVPKEDLVVRTREVVENQPIEADLRREKAEVRGEGDVRLRRDDRQP